MTINDLRTAINKVKDPRRWLELFALSVEEASSNPIAVADYLYHSKERFVKDEANRCHDDEGHWESCDDMEVEVEDDDTDELSQDQLDELDSLADEIDAERNQGDSHDTEANTGAYTPHTERTGEYVEATGEYPKHDDTFELDELDDDDTWLGLSDKELSDWEKHFDDVMNDKTESKGDETTEFAKDDCECGGKCDECKEEHSAFAGPANIALPKPVGKRKRRK